MALIPMIAVLFSLVGAPNTPASCGNMIDSPFYAYGVTFFAPPLPGPYPNVVLDGVTVCTGDLYLGADEQTRQLLGELEPYTPWAQYAGIGALVTMHEGVHAATGSRDECYVESVAWSLLPDVLNKYLSTPDEIRVALDAAKKIDYNIRTFEGHCN